MTTPDEDVRLGHYRAEERARAAAVPAPSPQPRPETHDQAIVTAHEGRPTVAEQEKRGHYP
jgi:hypothetical protein